LIFQVGHDKEARIVWEVSGLRVEVGRPCERAVEDEDGTDVHAGAPESEVFVGSQA